jgi:hypothetical protein
MRSPKSSTSLIYRGSSKHKNRPANEQKGTRCPEWTHATCAGGFQTDVHAHDWAKTKASALFKDACVDDATDRRYASALGIAFEAKSTADGTWHGYPIPWESVPVAIKNKWLKDGVVTRGQTRAHFKFAKSDIHWALKTDDR